MKNTRAGAPAIEFKTFTLKLDAPPDDEGRFEGYAAVFNNVDRQQDLIEPGAFKKTLQENSQVPILWQHDPDRPIGVSVEMKEDDKGLRVVGQLTLGVQNADEARLLMQAGALKGLSIGYRAIKPVFANGVRRLKEIALFEWSPVTFPANALATVATVKGADVRKMYGLYGEDVEEVGYLLAMISAGTNFAQCESDEGETDDLAAMQSILSALANLLASELAEFGADDDGDESMSAYLADIFFKEGRVLSTSNRTLVEQAVKALQALLDASEPPAKGTQDDGAAVTEALEELRGFSFAR